MRCGLLALALACTATFVSAACPNQCSGHGRCGEFDRCECYKQVGTTWGERYMWTGADCSQRTCPLGRAFEAISTQDHRVSNVVLSPADATSVSNLHVEVNGKFELASDVTYFVRVNDVALGDPTKFTWRTDDQEFFNTPIEVTASTSADSYATAVELNVNGVTSGVRIWFDLSVGTANVDDVYTFTVTPNAGVDRQLDDANTVHQEIECSGRGLCDSSSGRCQCFDGYSGEACQRTTCPNSCSGHGVCQELRRFASDASDELSEANIVYTDAYDARKEMGCSCDAGFRGPDCSLIECPSGEDPLTGDGGEEGRDCSGRGICDYSTGVCKCFKGYYGERCEGQTNYM
jgi:hypothetical protein